MPPIFSALPAGSSGSPLRTRLGALAGLVTLLALVMLGAGLLPGCSNPHETPRVLFTHIQELNTRGKYREIWDLYTDKERKRQSDAWDSYREFLRTNLSADNREACQRNWGREPEELMGLTHSDLFEILGQGNESAMIGARITDDDVAPDLENGHRVYWVTAQGQELVMLAQFVDDGWYLVTLRE